MWADVNYNIAVKEVMVPKDAKSWKLREKALMPRREKTQCFDHQNPQHFGPPGMGVHKHEFSGSLLGLLTCGRIE